MVPQHYKFTWIIELYTYNEWILWDVNYTPIYLFFFLKITQMVNGSTKYQEKLS